MEVTQDLQVDRIRRDQTSTGVHCVRKRERKVTVDASTPIMPVVQPDRLVRLQQQGEDIRNVSANSNAQRRLHTDEMFIADIWLDLYSCTRSMFEANPVEIDATLAYDRNYILRIQF